MIPKERMTKVIAVLAALGLLGGGAIIWMVVSNTSTVVSNALVPPLVVARPLADYEPASDEAVTALSAALSAGDDPALPSAAVRAKNALMGLTVPAEARAAHLALILALSRFEQEPSSEARAALAAAVEAFSR